MTIRDIQGNDIIIEFTTYGNSTITGAPSINDVMVTDYLPSRETWDELHMGFEQLKYIL